MRIEPKLENLLVELVEAERRVPREQREHFYVARSVGPPGVHLIHPGWQRRGRVPEVDLEQLHALGFLLLTASSRGDPRYSVSPAGREYYSKTLSRQGEALERVEARVRRHLDSTTFRSRHPRAYKKWVDAEVLVWEEDSARNVTTIGHLCREALQEFATSLVAITKAPNVDPDPAKTVARIRVVLKSRRVDQGESVARFLDALVGYWGAVSDLAQRQEHGAQKEGGALTEVDSLRLLRQTMLVMFEIDNACC